jgi:hypothetical protein
MFFPQNLSSELFLDLSEEQQETVAGGKVYENNKQYYEKTETSDGGNTDSTPQTGTKDKSIVGQPKDLLSSFDILARSFQTENQLMFPTKMIF